MEQFLFVDLAGLTPGKAFAGFAAGSFVDMNGRAVEFEATALKAFVANTLRAIDLAKGKGMPGLPIDARAHDKGEAAGWIVGAAEGEVTDSAGEVVPVIMLSAEWTKLGLELLKDKIMANFSPTVDLRSRVIRGGSLTNWPASVDGNGAPLFPAVELAAGMYRLQQERSLEAQASSIRKAFSKQFGGERDGYSSVWVLEVFEAYVIVGGGERQFRVAYTEGEDGAVVFVPREEWVGVEQAWVEATLGRALTEAELGRRLETAAVDVGVSPGAAGKGEGDRVSEVVEMNVTKEELAELVAEQVRATLAGEKQRAARPDGAPAVDGPVQPSFDVLKFLEMGEATDGVVGAFKQQMLDQYELMKQRAATEAAEMIGRIRREADIAEFTQMVTGGTPDVPYGLPVSAEDLKEFLGRLQPVDLQFAKKLLGDIQQHGRQKFTELGHGKTGQGGGAELPAVYARMLDSGQLAVADLGAPELALGDLGQYDLSRWNGGK